MLQDGEDCTLNCCIKLNFLDGSNTVKKTVNEPKAVLHLMRNQFRDIFLKINSVKIAHQFVLKDLALHTRFVKEGKATIKLNQPNVQIFISNCPPNKLFLFLKMVMAKVERLKTETTVPLKEKLISQKAKGFEEISPLSVIDVNILQNKLLAKPNSDCPETPKTGKRKFNSADKENPKSPQRKLTSTHRIARPLASIVLTREQQKVMSAVMSGLNVFFTGSAGTGKSYLLKRILGALPPESTFATASTGVAACQIGGTTLHAFAGIGFGNASVSQCSNQALKRNNGQQWKKCQHLIVDEISMVDGEDHPWNQICHPYLVIFHLKG